MRIEQCVICEAGWMEDMPRREVRDRSSALARWYSFDDGRRVCWACFRLAQRFARKYNFDAIFNSPAAQRSRAEAERIARANDQ